MSPLSRSFLVAAFVALAPSLAEAGASVRIYSLPEQDGYLLSTCLDEKEGCGKAAADAWCQSNGYQEALTFQREQREAIARRLGSGAFCDGPVCETFRQIKCYTPADSAAADTANN